jgi:dihydrodiol dehydrogenase / D-xylose 1-dehydrogenase (NADP)
MSTKTRWGIIATGWVSDKFAGALKLVPEAERVAVGSRSQKAADAFGEKHDIPKRHASYEALVSDPDVDVVYVGTPHNFHCENTLKALEAGKHVLCEKPLAVNAREATEMIAVARKKRLFLMEAMWTRFVPAWADIKARLDAGEFGEIASLQANFGLRRDYDPKHRLFNPDLAGGALLDLGIYPVSLASWLLGKPDTVSSWAKMADTGVDQRAAMTFTYGGGRFAQLSTASDVWSSVEAEIVTEKAIIRAHRLFIEARSYEVFDFDRTEVVRKPFENGFQFEAEHAMDCIREGRTESEVMPLDESLEIVRTMDALREEWGLKYPFE